MASETRGCSNNSKKMYEGEAKYYIYSTGDQLQGCLVFTTTCIMPLLSTVIVASGLALTKTVLLYLYYGTKVVAYISW